MPLTSDPAQDSLLAQRITSGPKHISRAEAQSSWASGNEGRRWGRDGVTQVNWGLVSAQ